LLTVYVPARNAKMLRMIIEPKSGIVGSPAENNPAELTIDYEGNIYGSPPGSTYADRVYAAASRHAEKYPTVARTNTDPSQVVKVGVWDDQNGIVMLVGEGPQLLAEWLEVTEVPPQELLATAGSFGRLRALQEAARSSNPGLKSWAQYELLKMTRKDQ
jgi:hypothetical protein